MKGFWGLLVIIAFYGALASISYTGGFSDDVLIIFYIVLFCLSFLSMILVNKFNSKKMLITWISLSTIPVALFSLYSYYYTTWGGWDLGLWELFIPFFIGISQVITIILSLILIMNKNSPKV